MPTITTMRRAMVKVKRKRPASRKPLPERTDDVLVGEEEQSPRPFPAMQAIYRPPPKPWWSSWRVILSLSTFLVVTVLGVYWLGKTDKLGSDPYVEARTAASNANRRGGTGFMPGRGREGDTTWGSTADYSAPTAESFIATYGGGIGPPPSAAAPKKPVASNGAAKRELDRNFSGNCTVNANRLEDLENCLRNASSQSPR